VSSADPEVEETQDAWPDVIEWKPGYGAANLPPPRSRPDSTFPLQQVRLIGCNTWYKTIRRNETTDSGRLVCESSRYFSGPVG
jgi:hypothetical protein